MYQKSPYSAQKRRNCNFSRFLAAKDFSLFWLVDYRQWRHRQSGKRQCSPLVASKAGSETLNLNGDLHVYDLNLHLLYALNHWKTDFKLRYLKMQKNIKFKNKCGYLSTNCSSVVTRRGSVIIIKMGQSMPLFCLFSFFSRNNFNTNWKKLRWCAWDSNPGPQDGRRRQNHGAMAATPSVII